MPRGVSVLHSDAGKFCTFETEIMQIGEYVEWQREQMIGKVL